MIRVPCPSCNVTIKCPDSAAGKKGSCPRCKQPVIVPVPEGGLTPPPCPLPVEPILPQPQPNDPAAVFNFEALPQNPYASEVDDPAAVRERLIKGGLVGAFVGSLVFAGIGIFLSQYWPVFGDFLEKSLAQPWSPARESLIPIHVFVFSIVGFVLGGILGAANDVLVQDTGSRRQTPRQNSTIRPRVEEQQGNWRDFLGFISALLGSLAAACLLLSPFAWENLFPFTGQTLHSATLPLALVGGLAGFFAKAKKRAFCLLLNFLSILWLLLVG